MNEFYLPLNGLCIRKSWGEQSTPKSIAIAVSLPPLGVHPLAIVVVNRYAHGRHMPTHAQAPHASSCGGEWAGGETIGL